MESEKNKSSEPAHSRSDTGTARSEPIDHGEARRPTREEVVIRVKTILEENGEMSIREISDIMGYRSPPSYLRREIKFMMAIGLVGYTQPGSPNSPSQKIRLLLWPTDEE